MGIIKRTVETIGLVMVVAVLFYFPMDWIRPYVLPMTLIGIALILGVAFYTFKKRSLMMLIGIVMMSMMMATPTLAANKLKDCGGSYTTAQGLASGLQDATMSGNIFSSDFKDEKVLKCVQENIKAVRGDICSAPIKDDSYDNEIRNYSFYVADNFYRMSSADVSGSFWKWAFEKVGLSKNDLRATFKCAEKYMNNAASIDKALESQCRTVGQTIQKGAEDCWPCSLVGMFIETIQTMASNMYPYVNEIAFYILGMVFLFWIAFRVLKFIGTLGYGDPGEFMTDLLVRFITVAIVAAILQAPIVDFYRIALSPFINMTAALSGKLSEMSMTDGQTTFAEQAQKKMGLKWDDACKSCQLMQDPDYEFPAKEGQIVVMDAQSVNGLLCMTCQAYRQVMPMIAIGEKMNCYALSTGTRIPLVSIVIPKFAHLIVGMLLVIIFSILSIIIAFYILDVILRLGFVIVLTPLFIAAWAFPSTREYSTKAWHMILFCLLQFIGIAVMMALFVNICTAMMPGDPSSLIKYMVNDNVDGMYKVITGMEPLPPALGGAGGAVGGVAIVGGAVAGSGVALAAGGVITGLFLILLIGFVLLALKMLMSTEKIVEHLSGISLGITSISLGALTSMIQEGAQLAGLGGAAAGVTGKKVGEKAKDKLQKGKQDSKSASKNRFSGGSGGPSGADIGGSDGGQTPSSTPKGPKGGDPATDKEGQEKQQQEKSERNAQTDNTNSEGQTEKSEQAGQNENQARSASSSKKGENIGQRAGRNTMIRGAELMEKGYASIGLVGLATMVAGATAYAASTVASKAIGAGKSVAQGVTNRFAKKPNKTMQSPAQTRTSAPVPIAPQPSAPVSDPQTGGAITTPSASSNASDDTLSTQSQGTRVQKTAKKAQSAKKKYGK